MNALVALLTVKFTKVCWQLYLAVLHLLLLALEAGAGGALLPLKHRTLRGLSDEMELRLQPLY